ncbi:contactin-associated protein-like 4 isoform X2 [Silurus meridionalis]|nr:contactin-associated protein-like 4 isoform X2 [Silurus meridionalis]
MDLPFVFLTKLFLMLGCVRLSCCKDGCDSPLVSNLPQAAFKSSSQLSNSHGPGYAKLNRRDGAGGWSPMNSNRNQWLEINFVERTEVTAIATQGRYGSSDWVTQYLLMFSDTGHNWRQYRQEDSIGAFSGNTNADSVVSYKLQQPVFARYLRVLPLDWNPNGRIGLRLEAYGCRYKSDVASFDGASFLLFKPNTITSPYPRELLTMNFKTLHNSGVLMHMDSSHGHTLTLEVLRGKLFIHLRKGNFHTAASLGSLLDDQHWHHVSIERLRGHVNFTVDKSDVQPLQFPEHQSHFEINEISFGGISADGTQGENSERKFHGCLENVQYNGINVIDLAKRNQLTAVGNITFSCLEAVDMPVTFTTPESFLQLPWTSTRDTVSVGLQFRTWNRAGLLMTFDLQQQAGMLSVYLSEARARAQVRRMGRIMADITAGSALNDGQWHSVDLSIRRGRLILAVDKLDMSTVTISFPIVPGNQIFLGGCPITEDECKKSSDAFQGCMRLIQLDEGAPVDLIKVQQTLIGNFSDLQVDMCGIIDRCSPSHCEHGGRCTQSWSTFHCDCSSTGYKGATCHSSVYEASCEAYKHRGNTSGLYHVDIDGSGPIKPQLIYCNMSDKAWMVIQHNNTELTKLRPSSGSTQHSASFNYSADAEQLAAIITRAEHCEQELSYHCKKSRLLNTPDGTPFTWWVGRSGDAHTYWAGSPAGTQQCACAVQNSCMDSKHLCNCDSDLDDWLNDSGVLSHKEHLPIRMLAVGDISRPGSEAAYQVGPLQCYGDNDFWNAAHFDKENSHLHFPTFHAELSADISFFFKTSSSSGVFLENLGIKDFIRVELRSPTEVIFSFDVGNGPLEVRVKTPVHLNDERWHHVVAERNIKEASLSVDHHPGSVQKAPTEGHIHLQLNSQLFVGGTASRQKGFLGCIRSLKLNGKTLNLEERAKITPGVRPGCPGHCSSYGYLCQNQGQCLDKDNGFTCDCGASSYSGTFCHKEVSAFFRPATSVTYTFKEPYELIRNGSAMSSSMYSDLTLKGENVSLSFRTSQAPVILLYASSYYREFLAIFLNRNGQLEVKYKLQNNRDADVFRSSAKSLANGQLHRVSIRRVLENLSIQIDQNAREDFNLSSDVDFNAIKAIIIGRVPEYDESDTEISHLTSQGFTGCLSVVQFNSISPLKAALLYPHTSPVAVTGTLTESNCGSSSSSSPYAAETTHSLSDHVGTVGEPVVNAISGDSALIGGVIAVVIFVILACLAIMARFFYRRKDTFQTQESKEVKEEDGPETVLNADHGKHSVINESQKEYFI